MQHDTKPTMIAESTPFGGIELKQANKKVQKILADQDLNNDLGDVWDRWYAKVLDIINKYDISMWCYIDADWESQPMWHNVGFGDTRVATNEVIMAKWQEQIINNGLMDRKFLMSGSIETCGVNITDSSKKEENLLSDFELDRLRMRISFIVVPFLLVSAIFFVPFVFLGENKMKIKRRAKEGEKKRLLADIDKKFLG